jgi:sarcosine oxidase
MGVAATHALATAGHEVTVFEQYAPGHERASSHGPSRIIRLTYETADYIALARDAFRRWGELEDAAGEELVVPTGGLDFGPPDANYMAEMRDAMALAGVPFEELPGEEIRRRFPQIAARDDEIGFYQADFAMLVADRCIAALLQSAEVSGARVRTATRVHSVAPDGDGCSVETTRGAERFDRVVLAAGSWMGPLCSSLGLDLALTPIKEQLAFFAVADPAAYAPGSFPLMIRRSPHTTTLGSAFPLLGVPVGVKAMLDRLGPPVADPDDPDRSIEPDIAARLDAWIADTLPGLGHRIADVSCRYTMTPDEDFVLGLHPEHPQIVIAAPCSGHGFKFAPTIGAICADLAIEGVTPYDIERFRLDRPALQEKWSPTRPRLSRERERPAPSAPSDVGRRREGEM